MIDTKIFLFIESDYQQGCSCYQLKDHCILGSKRCMLVSTHHSTEGEFVSRKFCCIRLCPFSYSIFCLYYSFIFSSSVLLQLNCFVLTTLKQIERGSKKKKNRERKKNLELDVSEVL